MVTEEELKNMSPEQVARMQEENCIFCHIVSGKIPSKKVYEDDKVLAFLDINPANPGHILLIPKTHQAILPQMSDQDVGHMFKVSKLMSNSLLKSLQVKGTNIFVANGAVAGQKAPHFMVHIIPRLEDDGLNFTVPETDMPRPEIAGIKQRLLSKVGQVFGLSEEQMAALGFERTGQKGDAVAGPAETAADKEPADEIDGHEKKPADGETFDFDALKKVLDR